MLSTKGPFILLDDARAKCAAPARLYDQPREILSANNAGELAELFSRLREAGQRGFHVAGFLTYDAGHKLAQNPTGMARQDEPLAWFGIFDRYEEISPEEVADLLPSNKGAYLSPVMPQITRDQYAGHFANILDYIHAGDIYQANLTFAAKAECHGDPLALYATIRARAAAGYGGIVWTGDTWHLSFSPELFFALKDGRVTTKPMKGTAVRSPDNEEDQMLADALKADPKQRAENLMIVDLLRNDLSRVCDAGSVEVPDLFRIESYPTVHQMISTVTGTLQKGKGAVDLIEAIFPCGSITGAPKIRAMQIIDEIEGRNRGIYCGSIGRIDAGGDAAFNVAIRTFSSGKTGKDLQEAANSASLELKLGLGSGVVADSTMAAEWEECLAKGEFARMDLGRFDLIETMRFDPANGIQRLELHLERMKESARALGFSFDRHAARNLLHAATFHLEKASRIRLLAGPSGSTAIDVRHLAAEESKVWRVVVVPLPVDSRDFRLRHKTTDRAFYDDARRAGGADEVVFTDDNGFLTEGSISAIFVERGGRYLTPPLARGLLPSTLRRELLDNGTAREADLRVEDLAGGFYIGNSIRGLVAAILV